MLPEPTSGSQDWAKAGEANDAATATMAISLFIFISKTMLPVEGRLLSRIHAG
jgi:hypothetical protein